MLLRFTIDLSLAHRRHFSLSHPATRPNRRRDATLARTYERVPKNSFFTKLEPGFEPSDAFLTSTSEPYSTL